ncbi:alcohol dehydrogenase [Bifidobacterium goeldii]|uniref:Alcohol dehydrogenase n=2 Tax=Bifidobacterium goeldii TaxID=2306975 RepID=A0A430FN23_9BIFI|nr:alcohol dehydrogenase [Bifidobacterium goeldii]
MMQLEDRANLPWSHRLGLIARGVVTVLAGALVAVFGTFAHRMGAASNIPYGLAIAFLILILSTWCARARLDAVGLALHLIASSGTAWVIAGASTGDALTPIGFGGSVPYFSQHAGYIWLIGMILVQLGMLFMPASWFRIGTKPTPNGTTPRATSPSSSAGEAR